MATIANRVILGLDSVPQGAGQGKMDQTPVEMRQQNLLTKDDRGTSKQIVTYSFSKSIGSLVSSVKYSVKR